MTLTKALGLLASFFSYFLRLLLSNSSLSSLYSSSCFYFNLFSFSSYCFDSNLKNGFKLYPEFSDHCFTGDYPVKPIDVDNKDININKDNLSSLILGS